MSFDLRNMEISDIVKLIKDGVGSAIEERLYQEFKTQGEAAARKAAQEIANTISTRITGVNRYESFGPTVDLQFNMVSTNAKVIGTVVEHDGATPIIVWNNDYQLIAGQKVFVA